jgi:hypothetical protein
MRRKKMTQPLLRPKMIKAQKQMAGPRWRRLANFLR